ncbi:carbohydrate ABC transporter substrate-binding protein [Arthrobacter sp. ISL-85]|uniref:ABC transporter substrate-binding protein n=1 Tax=Arthrobacter sp. ISL-85 TaxID=2819115 RepID=UPI001BE94830|nr:ABC transporter substrate-binding protein [Arthrobacter sp. ISL-85]MBT2568844.1 carbohydrate ABC transporter substrate-binding protein [Arthrobacter sp. ISL-85]
MLDHTPVSRPRRKTFLRLTVLGTVLAAATALTGCSGSPGGSDADKTVSFYSWDNEATLKPVLDEFKKENPSIDLKVSYGTPVQGYISTLQTRINSGTAADVFIITAENKTEIMNGGFAKDLSGEPWIGNIADAAKATYTKDGKVYGAATASWGGGILYNKDLLAKVGFTNAPATWDEFLTLCKKLKDAGITPFYEGGDGIPVSLAALVGLQNEANGGTMDADIWAGKTSFTKTWTKPLEEWSQLFSQGLVLPSVAGLTGDQVTSEFEKGSVAMIGTGSWALGSIQKAAPSLKLDFMPVPGDSGNYWAGAVSPGYAINAKTEHGAAAEKLVEFLQSKTAVELFQKQTAAITTTKDFTPQLDPALSTMAPAVRDGKFYLPQVTWPTNSAALNSETVSLLQQLIQGQTTPDKVASALDAKLASLQGK